jgi:hypothetical protein
VEPESGVAPASEPKVATVTGPETLAAQMVDVLVPALPFLTALGQHGATKAAEKAGEQLGSNAWPALKSAWSRLFPQLKERSAEEPVRTLLADPDNKEGRNAFEKELAVIVASDPDIARQFQKVFALLPPDYPVRIDQFNAGHSAKYIANIMNAHHFTIGDQIGLPSSRGD